MVRRVYPGLTGLTSQVGGLVLSVSWSAIEPSPNGPIASNNKIDSTIAYARANHLRFKLRVNAGIQAPDWAKSLGGAPVTVTDSQDHVTGTIGRFWTGAYGQAYDQLQAELAAQYDNVPELAEVIIDRCTTVYAEPFLRQAHDPATAQALLAAGYTAAADQQCQQQQIDGHRVWVHTRSGLAFNPYDYIAANGTVSQDEGFTEQMMAYCRQQLGAACVFENDSIRWPELPGNYTRMYQHMHQLGAPIGFQTATAVRIGDPIQTITWAATVGANSVELSTVMPTVSLAQLIGAANKLQLNSVS